MPSDLTTVTILTPPGRGAVASISVEGATAVELVEQCFSAASGRKLTDVPVRRVVFGRWQTGNEIGEDLVVCRTAADRIEIHCHGGTAAVQAIVQSLVDAGARCRSPEEWADQHEPDVIAAEARLTLAAAKTERTALILLDQYRGALRREVEDIFACLKRGETAPALQRLRLLSQRSSVGQHLTQPWRVAIIGPPNVGKSSLMNALVGYSRSIVFDQPGTTRDIVRAETAFDGWPVELVDTAGLRESEDAIETAGVERAQQTMAAADLILRVSDSTEVNGDSPPLEHGREIAVYNKVDLPSDRDSFPWPGIKVSATAGQGLPLLIQTIIQSLVGVAPSSGDAVPFTLRQIAWLITAEQAVESGDMGQAVDFLERIARPEPPPDSLLKRGSERSGA